MRRIPLTTDVRLLCFYAIYAVPVRYTFSEINKYKI